MHANLKWLEFHSFWEVSSEDDDMLGQVIQRQGRWCFQPSGMFLTEDELLAIMVKVGQLNKNNKIIVIGGNEDVF